MLLVLSSVVGSHDCRFSGNVVSLQARSRNEMGFSFIFNDIQFTLRAYLSDYECGHGEMENYVESDL